MVEEEPDGSGALDRPEPETESESQADTEAETLPESVERISGALRAVVRAEIQMSFQGPIPPPEILAKYNDAVEGAADRIIGMAERQQEHRIELEKTVVKGDQRRSWGGLIAGVLVTVVAFAFAGYVAFLGQVVTGALFALAPIVVLAGTFVYGTRSRSEERQLRLKGILKPLLPESGTEDEESPE